MNENYNSSHRARKRVQDVASDLGKTLGALSLGTILERVLQENVGLRILL